MLYLVFPSLDAAAVRSADEAQRRDCTGGTLYWWAVVLAADNVHGLVLIGDPDTSGLTEDEQYRLLTTDQATAQGLLAPEPRLDDFPANSE